MRTMASTIERKGFYMRKPNEKNNIPLYKLPTRNILN